MGNKAIQQGAAISLPAHLGNLGDMLTRTATQEPQRGFIFTDSSGAETRLEYPELRRKALIILGQLQAAGLQAGNYAIVEIDDPAEFVLVFWACVYGGIIPAPIAKPGAFDPNEAGFAKLRNVWDILGQPVIITEAKNQEKYHKAIDARLLPHARLFSAQLDTENPAGAIQPRDLADTALIQFSSGSTGLPKGVQLSHRNILATAVATCQGAGMTREDCHAVWIPHTHDMGLIGQYMSGIMLGMNIIKMTPATFIRSPLLFLQKIVLHRASLFCSPNFGLDWINSRITDEQLTGLDLSSVRLIFNGAEPISVKVMDCFIQKFAPAGFRAEAMYPVYGMAEASISVSFPTPGSRPVVHRLSRARLVNDGRAEAANGDDMTELVSEGYAVPGMEIRIADREGQVVDEGITGEIHIRGLSVTSGYVNNAEQNALSFQDGWFKTGDLGFMRQGGLVVTGRLKDIIFLRGQNLYAHDIEEEIYHLEEVPRGGLAVLGLFNHRTQEEEILAFVKHKGKIEGFMPLRAAVIRQVNLRFGVALDQVIPVSTIPKTTSGKTQRFLLSAAYENGNHDEAIAELARLDDKAAAGPLVEPASPRETGLRQAWAKVLKLPESQIGVTQRFMEMGGNSIRAIQVLAEIEALEGREFDHGILLNCHTIREMAAYIETSQASAAPVSEQLRNHHEQRRGRKRRSQDLLHDIAITGIALRLPSADTPDGFWANLCSQKNCITPVSEHRKSLTGFPGWQGYMGEIENIDHFDNGFFNIPEADARFMDPQHRILLELAYESLEDAGILEYRGHEMNIGVYAGINYNGYIELIAQHIHKHGTDGVPANAMVGNMNNIVAAHVSHLFNFTGPSMSIDTACSSFSAALYQAVQEIRAAKIKGALIMSSNLIITPTMHALSKQAGILSKGSHCKVFDRSADGTVIGEGAFALYLEPLVHAVKAKRQIYGVIKGVGINNDGYSLGIMAPNPKGQHSALLNAYMDAGVRPDEISYVEAHGTGTAIGDPVEIKALNRLFKEFTPLNQYCAIGSVKSNIGHLLPTAGAAGLVKTLLCLKNRTLVPTLNLHQPNPTMEIENSAFYLVDSVRDWPGKPGFPRRAGVSSFGFGGTNVHMVVEEYLPFEPEAAPQEPGHWQVLTFSARSETALHKLIGKTHDWLHDHLDTPIANVCYTRNSFRETHAHRRAVVFRDSAGLRELLGSPDGLAAQPSGHFTKKRPSAIHLLFDPRKINPRMALSASLYRNLKGLRLSLETSAASITAMLPGSPDLRSLIVRDWPVEQAAITPLFETLAQCALALALACMWKQLGLTVDQAWAPGPGEFLVAAFHEQIDDRLALELCHDWALRQAESGDDKLIQAGAISLKPCTHTGPKLFPFNQAAGQAFDAADWIAATAAPGRTEQALAALAGKKTEMLVYLALAATDQNQAESVLVQAGKTRIIDLTMDLDDESQQSLAHQAAQLYCSGLKIDWARLHPSEQCRMVSLPGYAFEHRRFWIGDNTASGTGA